MQIEVGQAVKLSELYKNLEFDDPNDEQTKAQIAILGHFSQQADLSQGHMAGPEQRPGIGISP